MRQRELPFWIVDAESSLDLIAKDLFKEVLGKRLPKLDASSFADGGDAVLPITFGYNPTERRTVKFSFGNTVVTMECGKALETGGAIGVSHGSYNVAVRNFLRL